MEPFYTHFRLLINTHDIILSLTTQAQNGAISAGCPSPVCFDPRIKFTTWKQVLGLANLKTMVQDQVEARAPA